MFYTLSFFFFFYYFELMSAMAISQNKSDRFKIDSKIKEIKIKI